MSRVVSAGAQHRLFAARLRQVATSIGPGFVITITEEGLWMVDAIPAPKYPGESKRYYTRDWDRGARAA